MTKSTDSTPHTVQPFHPTLPDGSGTVSLPTAIVREVAAEKDVAPSELTPLYEVIDPDALAGLFNSSLNTSSQTKGRIVFDYCDCQVIVTSTSDIRTTPLDNL